MSKIYTVFIISFIFLVLNFIPFQLRSAGDEMSNELFDQSMIKLNTINKLVAQIDSIAYSKKCIPHSLEYNEIVTNVIKYRFRHGYCHYSLDQNWISAVLGLVIWQDFSAIVIPDDIMKFSNAACSQQTIVMMEILRKKGIPFKKIGWNHHFTLCAWVQNGWQFYDPNLEPILNMSERKFDHKFNDIDFLAKIYQYKIPKNQIEGALGKPFSGIKNEFPATRIKLFHHITFWLSRVLWFFILLSGLWLLHKKKGRDYLNKNYEV